MKWLISLRNWILEYWRRREEEEYMVTIIPKAPEPLPQAPKLPPKPIITSKPPTMSNQEKLYQTAAKCLDTHQTLNDTVPEDVGCGEAWSSVAKLAAVPHIPATGIAGTSNLYLWFTSNPDFEQVTEPEPGDTIISPTGHGNGLVTGHVGIVANHGILSNNSDNGLWQEKWTLPKWRDYYHVYGGLPMAYFRWRG